MSTRVLIALPGKLDIKRHSLSILYVLDMTAYYICCIYLDALQTTVVNGIKHYGLLIRLLPKEQSDLGPYCLQYRLLKNIRRTEERAFL